MYLHWWANILFRMANLVDGCLIFPFQSVFSRRFTSILADWRHPKETHLRLASKRFRGFERDGDPAGSIPKAIKSQCGLQNNFGYRCQTFRDWGANKFAITTTALTHLYYSIKRDFRLVKIQFAQVDEKI